MCVIFAALDPDSDTAHQIQCGRLLKTILKNYCPDLPASAILAMTVSSAGFIVSNVLPDTESTKALLIKS
jgi:hypothetical protein